MQLSVLETGNKDLKYGRGESWIKHTAPQVISLRLYFSVNIAARFLPNFILFSSSNIVGFVYFYFFEREIWAVDPGVKVFFRTYLTLFFVAIRFEYLEDVDISLPKLDGILTHCRVLIQECWAKKQKEGQWVATGISLLGGTPPRLDRYYIYIFCIWLGWCLYF